MPSQSRLPAFFSEHHPTVYLGVAVAISLFHPIPSFVLLEEFFVFSLKCISTDSWNNFCEDDPAWLLSVAVAATGSSQTWSHVAAAAGESYTCGPTVCPHSGLLLIYLHLFSFLHPVGLTCNIFLYEKNMGTSLSLDAFVQ